MGTKERRAQEKQRRLNQILDAARQLLFSDGMDKISMNKIAKAAELGVGTLYFYFNSKEEIFVALQEEGLKLFYSLILDIYRSDSRSSEKLRQVSRALYRFSCDHKDYLDIINFFLSSSKEYFEPELKNKIDMSGSKIFRVIEDIICQGVETGHFREVDAKKYAILFFGSLRGILQLKKLEKTALQGEDHQQIYEFSAETLISGLLPA